MTDYKITISPDLEINATDFVTAWNDTANCREVAKAQLETSAAVDYDPLLAGAAAVFLSGKLHNRQFDRHGEVVEQD